MNPSSKVVPDQNQSKENDELLVATPVNVAPGPAVQSMSDGGSFQNHLVSQPGLLVRQRLRLKNCIPCLNKSAYDVGTFPQGLDPTGEWEDDVFANARGHMTASEESDCFCRWYCGNFRAFTMHVFGGPQAQNNEILTMQRPFKLPCLPCCYPQRIENNDAKTGAKIGVVEQDFRCVQEFFCGKSYWKVYDKNDNTKYVIERDVCCNKNMCAPSCCVPIHRFDIYDKDEQQVVGSLENIFPGCNLRLCFHGLIDNYRLTFPKDATPEDKANLFAATLLVDYMVFSNKDDGDL